MMHRCLQEYNKPKLPHGMMLVNRQNVKDHLKAIKKCLTATDTVMLRKENKDFANSQSGRDIGKIWAGLNNVLHMFLISEIKVPLKRLCDEIDDLMPEEEK